MFSTALKSAMTFTRPVIISHSQRSGACVAGCGAFVVINEEGWMITAAHILDNYTRFEQQKVQNLAYAAEKG